MVGLNFHTAKEIIRLSRPKSGKPKQKDCTRAIKAKTFRKNYKEIFNLLYPYISNEKNMEELASEWFIRDGLGKKVKKIINNVDNAREQMKKRMEKSVRRAGGSDNIYVPN